MFACGLFVIGALIILMSPAGVSSASGQIRSRPLQALLTGFALIVCVPVAAILAMVSVIGIPVGILLMLMWPIVVMLGYLAGALLWEMRWRACSAETEGTVRTVVCVYRDWRSSWRG